MQNDNTFLGTERIGKLLFRLALPAVTAQLVNMLYNLVDRIYIGHIPETGSLALTGVGVCMPLIMLISAFAALVSMGAAPRASIRMGEGDYAGAERILGNSLFPWCLPPFLHCCASRCCLPLAPRKTPSNMQAII